MADKNGSQNFSKNNLSGQKSDLSSDITPPQEQQQLPERLPQSLIKWLARINCRYLALNMLERINKMNRNKPREDSSSVPGAAYIRFSSEIQSDSFSLNTQLRQIKEQAEGDGVEIGKVFSDPGQSAYSKKYRPGINAMREVARRGEFKILYVHLEEYVQ